jgi:hypothetical protein
VVEVNQFYSIAPAIEDKVVAQIFEEMDGLLEYEPDAQGHQVVRMVVSHFSTKERNDDVTPGYVSGLLWELIADDQLRIDKFGAISRGIDPPF